MRILYAAGLAIIATAAIAAGISAGDQLQLIPIFQTPQKPAAAMQPAPATPSPVVIEIADGTCVEREYRATWTISEGETPGDIALATLNGVEDWIDKAYKILELNDADEYALPVGQNLLIANGWQKPEIMLPKQPIVLEQGQPFAMRLGLQGLLCDSAHLELSGYSIGHPVGDFNPGTQTFRFVPEPYDAGIHRLLFRAGDDDITTYGIQSPEAYRGTVPSVLRVKGIVELHVKAKPQ